MPEGRPPGHQAPSRTPLQKIAAATLALPLLVALPAMFSAHLPSDLGVRVAEWTAITATALAAWSGRKGGMLDSSETQRGNRLMAHPITRIPVLALFTFLTTFVAVEGGALALVTGAIGKSGHRELTVTGASRQTKGCDRFVAREVAWLFNRALCGSDEDLIRAEHGGRLTVFGVASPFGLNVERYELRTVVDPPSGSDVEGDTPRRMP